MKFHEQTGLSLAQHEQMHFPPNHPMSSAPMKQLYTTKNPRGIQLEKKTEIQYKGAAGDAGNDLLDQSSSNMMSSNAPNRHEDSTRALNESSKARSTKITPD